MVHQLKKDGFAGQQYCIIPDSVLKSTTCLPLCDGLFATDIGFYPDAQYHMMERKRGCNQHVLIYCTKGSGWFEINDNKFALQHNQVVILPRNIPHRYGTNEENPWSIYWLHFAGNNADALLKHLKKTEEPAAWPVHMNSERISLFDRILLLFQMSANMDNIINANLLLPHYLMTFSRDVSISRASVGKADVIDGSIAYMKTKLSTVVDLKNFAEQASLSISQYSTLFKQKTHDSPQNYFTFLKMQQACQLLEHTNLSVNAIARQVGYQDQFHFSRVFKKNIGTSPRKFRFR